MSTAGDDYALALTHDGTIVSAGEAWSGTLPPTGQDYTDIALGPDYGFVIKDAGPELTITGPLSPGQPVSCLEHDRLSAENLIIPYGSTIEHTDHEVTRIIRPNLSELGWANDREAEALLIPGQGSQFISTRVYQEMGSSIIVDESTPSTTLIKDNITKNVIFTIRESNPLFDRGTSYMPTPNHIGNVGTDPIIQDLTGSPSWVVWAAHQYRSSTTDFGSYEADWIVPEAPKEHPFDPTDKSKNTQSCFFNSVESYDSSGRSGGILQPVLAYNWVQKYNPDRTKADYNEGWSAWIYDLKNQQRAVSSKITDISPGDTIKWKITYDGSSWKADLTRTKKSDGTSTPIFLTKIYAQLDARNVDTEVVYEAYLKANPLTEKSSTHEEKYFLSNAKFDPIVLKDINGNVISNAFGAYANKEWWDYKSTQCPHIGVDVNSFAWFYSVDLKTTS